MEDSMEIEKHLERHITVEREIVVDRIRFRIKSVFIGQTNLDDALKNIIFRRME
jgi:hypothetical protein